MAGSVKSDQDASRCKIGKAPIPAIRGTSAIISRHKRFFGSTETQCVGGSNWEPNDIEDEVQKDEERRAVEHIAEQACYWAYWSDQHLFMDERNSRGRKLTRTANARSTSVQIH